MTIKFPEMTSGKHVSEDAKAAAAVYCAKKPRGGEPRTMVRVIVPPLRVMRKDTRSPLVSMLLQATICLALTCFVVRMQGVAVLITLGLSFSASIAVGAGHLLYRITRGLDPGSARLAPSLIRVVAGAVAMAGPAWLTATVVPRSFGFPLSAMAGIVAAALAGGAVYLVLQALWRTPELAALLGGLSIVRAKTRRVVTAGGIDDD